jgi:CheY-like chemotaxis protein
MKALSQPNLPFRFDVSGPRPVLLIDDDDDAILLIQLLLKRSGVSSPVNIATDGERAVTYFESWMKNRAVPLPQIVFLDLRLPRTSGFEVLKWIRAQPDLVDMPVMIMSSSNRALDLETAHALGADFYCEKYPAHEELVALFAGKTSFPAISSLEFG